MNGKKAKQIRRIARNLTQGKHYVGYRYLNKRNNTIVMDDVCTRKVTKKLKMLYVNEARA